MLQKRAVHNVYGFGYREHTDPFIKEMKLLRISDLYKYLIGVCIYAVFYMECGLYGNNMITLLEMEKYMLSWFVKMNASDLHSITHILKGGMVSQ